MKAIDLGNKFCYLWYCHPGVGEKGVQHQVEDLDEHQQGDHVLFQLTISLQKKCFFFVFSTSVNRPEFD